MVNIFWYQNLAISSAREHPRKVTYRWAILSSSLHLVPPVATSWNRFRTCSSSFLFILTKSRFSILKALASVLASRVPQSGDFSTLADPLEPGRTGEMWPFISESCGDDGGEKLSCDGREYVCSRERNVSSGAVWIGSRAKRFSGRGFRSSGGCSDVWQK